MVMEDIIENNGCIETTESPDTCPLIVTIIGPIRIWWGEWGSERHKEYSDWRDTIRLSLVQAGCAVYSPHRAIQGSWNIKLQEINDAAIRISDLVVVMTPPGVEANGTAGEMLVAEEAGIPTFLCPPKSDNLHTDLLHIVKTAKLLKQKLSK